MLFILFFLYRPFSVLLRPNMPRRREEFGAELCIDRGEGAKPMTSASLYQNIT